MLRVEENKFNAWRVDSYKKEIDLAKANGNEADLRAYTRRLKNFQQRLIDEKQAYEAATARTNNNHNSNHRDNDNSNNNSSSNNTNHTAAVTATKTTTQQQ